MTTPVVLCGVSKVMGGRIAPRLAPELEVIQFITSSARAKSEIALLQAGKHPTPDPDDVGTHDFSRKPEAVLFGRGFDGPLVEEIFKACDGPSSGLVWLRADDAGIATVKSKPPELDEGALDKYADMTVGKIREALRKVREDGGWGKGGIHTYGME